MYFLSLLGDQQGLQLVCVPGAIPIYERAIRGPSRTPFSAGFPSPAWLLCGAAADLIRVCPLSSFTSCDALPLPLLHSPFQGFLKNICLPSSGGYRVSFSALRSRRPKPTRIHAPRRPARLSVRSHLRRRHGLCGSSRGTYRRRLHSHRGHLHQLSARQGQGLDSGMHHRPDRRQCRPVDCRGRHLYPPRTDLSRFRSRILPNLHAGAHRRLSRRAIHGAVATAAHCRGAWQFEVPRRHGLRRRAHGRRQRRGVCQPRLFWTWPRRALHLLPEQISLRRLAQHTRVSARPRHAARAQRRVHQG